MTTNRRTWILPALALLVLSVPQVTSSAQQSAAKPARVAPVSAQKTVVTSTSRLTTRDEDKRYASDRITSPGNPSGFICETHNHFTSCECEGALDCFELAQSGKCDGGTWWEDDNDPSKGGCDFDDP